MDWLLSCSQQDQGWLGRRGGKGRGGEGRGGEGRGGEGRGGEGRGGGINHTQSTYNSLIIFTVSFPTTAPGLLPSPHTTVVPFKA